jgi:hypothetical protein
MKEAGQPGVGEVGGGGGGKEEEGQEEKKVMKARHRMFYIKYNSLSL